MPPSSLESPGASDSSVGDYAFEPATARSRRPRPLRPERPEAKPVFDDDDQLADLASAKRGNREALERLLNRHVDRLYAVCLRFSRRQDTAQDLLHDALVKIIAALPQFRGESRVSTWMLRVAVNTCLSHHRTRQSRREVSLEAGAGAACFASSKTSEPQPLDRVQHRDRLDRVERAFAALQPGQRAILTLRDLQGLEYQEIAEVLGVPIGTVKSRLFRARVALREGVERQSGDGDGPAQA